MVTTSMDPHRLSSEHTTPSEKTPGGTVSRNTEESTDGGSTGSAECPVPKSGKAMLSDTLVQVRQRLHDISPITQMEQTTKLRRSYILNLSVLSTGFFFLFASFFAIRDTLSSIHHHGNLGLISLACIYGSFVLGCTISVPVVRKVRPKYTILWASFGLSIYTAANFFPRFETLVPTSIILGISLAPLWTAQGTYITSLAIGYAAVTNRAPEKVLGLFNGVFLFVLQMSHVVGNLIASGVFSIMTNTSDPNSSDGTDNISYVSQPVEGGLDNSQYVADPDKNDMAYVLKLEEDTSLYLDPSECVWSNRMSWMVIGMGERNPTLIFIFVGILCALNVIGILVLTLCLGKLDVIFSRPGGQGKGLLGLHRQPRLLLLLPMMLYLGMEEGFVYGEITHVFVSCGVGVHMVGFAMVFFCASSSIASFLVGCIQATVGRRLILMAGGLLNLGLLVLLFLWRSEAGLGTVFGVLLALGAVDGVWQTQACTVCGVVLGSDSGFACLRLYEALGLCLSFSLSTFLSTHVILCINAGVLVVALLTYTVAEIVVKKEKNREKEREKEREPEQSDE